MPIMDGIEATKIIKRYENENGLNMVPIIALTANALKGDRERLLQEGLDEYISKPIEMSELLYILHKFLSHKSTLNFDKIDNSYNIDNSETVIVENKVQSLDLEEKIILIAKKFLLSNKILSTIIASANLKYDILDESETLIEKIKNKNYDIVFTDEEYLTKEILELIKNNNINIVLTDGQQQSRNYNGVTVKAINKLANKDEIISIIKDFRNIR